MRHAVVLSGVLGACLATACRNITGASAVCTQTYEFGNTGCFAVDGQVVGASGQPLLGIVVSARTVAGRGAYAANIVKTDSGGRFRVRAIRFDGPTNSVLAPDTVSVYVVASDPQEPSPGAAWRRDSVLTLVTVAPVGAVPVPAVLSRPLRLP